MMSTEESLLKYLRCSYFVSSIFLQQIFFMTDKTNYPSKIGDMQELFAFLCLRIHITMQEFWVMHFTLTKYCEMKELFDYRLSSLSFRSILHFQQFYASHGSDKQIWIYNTLLRKVNYVWCVRFISLNFIKKYCFYVHILSRFIYLIYFDSTFYKYVSGLCRSLIRYSMI